MQPTLVWGRRGPRKIEGPRVWHQNEDVALGWWLSKGVLAGALNVIWVRVNDRIINMACSATLGGYQRP